MAVDMWCTCLHVEYISKMIQIRAVPEHRVRRPEISGSARRHEPFRLHQEGVGACSRATDDAGMAGIHARSEADPGQVICRADNTRVARPAMIVLDASVVVELVSNGSMADPIRTELAGSTESLLVSHLIDVEVVSALGRLAASQRVDGHGVAEFVAALTALPVERFAHTPLR